VFGMRSTRRAGNQSLPACYPQSEIFNRKSISYFSNATKVVYMRRMQAQAIKAGNTDDNAEAFMCFLKFLAES
jgi:hypothetical protein